MPSTFDLCEKYFGTRDIYEIMEISKDAAEEELRKAYRQVAKDVHPDRANAEEIAVATEKFKLINSIYTLLMDKCKNAALLQDFAATTPRPFLMAQTTRPNFAATTPLLSTGMININKILG